MAEYQGLCNVPGLTPKVHCLIKGSSPPHTADIPRDLYVASGGQPRWEDLENCPRSDEVGHAEGGDEA
jgi:hypothetical protein